MRKANNYFLLLFALFGSFTGLAQQGEYTLVVEGFDWGPAVSKVILHLDSEMEQANASDYSIQVRRTSDCIPEDSPQTKGILNPITAYLSDAKGNRAQKGEYLTIHVGVGPHIQIGSPILYFFSEGCRGNQWTDYQLTITNKASKKVWNQETNRIIPLVDEFDLTGTFTNGSTTLKYASYRPKSGKGKLPLIIWLHGGGEGGSDPSIVLLANRAANYASPQIQSIFGGAHVLVPQSPTYWMQNAKGELTTGKENDIYNAILMEFFRQYLKEHPSVDKNRIYIGGCSNGGYMTQKLMLLHPDFFAAGFPSALAYGAEYLTDKDIETLMDQSIWYIHSKDDPVTLAANTVVPTYERLTKMGAKDIHLSLYDHVIDLYGVYGGEDFHFNGHFSWIYSHRNHASTIIEGKNVTIMEWLASKTKH